MHDQLILMALTEGFLDDSNVAHNATHFEAREPSQKKETTPLRKELGSTTERSNLFKKSIYEIDSVILQKERWLKFVNLGNIVKLKRIELQIKQSQLCKGICTPSYLSRIENNSVIPCDSIFQLLFSKLNIDFQDVKELPNKMEEDLETIYQDILLKKYEHNSQYFEVNESTILNISGDLLIKFKIVHARALLQKGNFGYVEKVVEEINKVIILKDDRTSFLFVSLYILMKYHKASYKEAVDFYEKWNLAYNFNDCKEYEIGILYYNIALCLRKLYRYAEALILANKALKIFNSNYLLEFSLNTHILLGSSNNNIGLVNNALTSYNYALTICNNLDRENRTDTLLTIKNNIGACYESLHEIKKAIEYYQECVNLCNSVNIVTYLNLIRCNYFIGNISESVKFLKILKDTNTPRKLDPVYLLQINIFEILISEEDTDISTIIKIQKEAINYFQENNLYDLVVLYCKIFATLYKKHHLYKKSSLMYQLALVANDKNNGGK